MLSLNEFREAFIQAGRRHAFTYDGLEALYDYLAEVGQLEDVDPEALEDAWVEYMNVEDACTESEELMLKLQEIRVEQIMSDLHDDHDLPTWVMELIDTYGFPDDIEVELSRSATDRVLEALCKRFLVLKVTSHGGVIVRRKVRRGQ